MDSGNCFGGHLWLALVSHQAVDLLLNIGQLGVTKPGKEFERRNALHQVAIPLEQFFVSLERSVKPVQQISLLGWNIFRYREEAADFRKHDGLSAISRATREQRLIDPNLRRQLPTL